MNELDEDTPTRPGPPKGWARWSQSLLESVFTTIAIGALVVAVVDGIFRRGTALRDDVEGLV